MISNNSNKTVLLEANHQIVPVVTLSNDLVSRHFINFLLRNTIMWTKPQATEMRFGFEVTMYVMNK